MFEYVELEYVQSTGTQYIDTGFKPDSNTKIQFKFMNLEVTGNCIIGNAIRYSETDGFRFFNYSSQCYLDYGSGDGYNRIYGGTCSANTLYEFEIGNRYVKNLVTGDNIISSTTVSFSQKSYNIMLNGANNFSKNKFYYVRIFNGTTLARYFIPVRRKIDNKVGMYDKVTRTFYSNAGVGEFIAGPEKPSYVGGVPFKINPMGIVSKREITQWGSYWNDPIDWSRVAYTTSTNNRKFARHPSGMGTVMSMNDGTGRNILVLDAQYRNHYAWGSGTYTRDHYCNISGTVTGGDPITTLPFSGWSDYELNNLYSERANQDIHTSRENTDYMMNINSSTTYAAGYCRSKTISYNGITVGCDLPNINVIIRLFSEMIKLDELDPSVSSSSSPYSLTSWAQTWSSSLYSASRPLYIGEPALDTFIEGRLYFQIRRLPILEI